MQFLCKLSLLAGLLLLSGFAPAELEQQIRDAAQRVSLDPKLVTAIIRVESNFKAHAVSAKGAMGLMQVMPKTADASDIHAPYHTVSNLMGACEYLRSLVNRYRGDLKLALAAYNAGPGNVERHGGVPPFAETRRYVKQVLSYYEELKQKRK